MRTGASRFAIERAPSMADLRDRAAVECPACGGRGGFTATEA
ncbi:MAG: primase-helicase zinc-binding domain-containing protein [Rhodoplanes sp.]